MKGQKKNIYLAPSKTHGITPKEKLKDRRCIGFSPFRGDCNRMFTPKNEITFMCDLCNDYITRNNLNE